VGNDSPSAAAVSASGCHATAFSSALRFLTQPPPQV